MRRTSCALATIALAVFAGACGGTDDPDEAAKVAAKKTFQARTARVCKPAPRIAAGDDAAATLAKVPGVRTAVAKRLDDLRRLGAPERDRALLEEYFQALERLVGGLPVVEDAARSGDRAALRSSLGASVADQERAADLAQRYGLEACS